MNSKSYVIFVLILLIPIYGNQSSGIVDLQPSSLTIGGSIVDNYANITYTIVYDNQASSSDTLISYDLGTPKDMYLSNVSASMGDEMFWGRVSPIGEAQQIFNQSISANKSAVLVTAISDGYHAEINVKAATVLELTFYVEGFLTRVLGIYEMELYKNLMPVVSLDLSIDIDIINSFSGVISARLSGLPGYTRTTITDGKHLSFSGTNFLLANSFSLAYSLAVLDFGGKLLTYNNGTDNFFAYLLAPEIQDLSQRESREYIFVIDVSGSMGGTKIQQAKTAFNQMIDTLGPNDLFNVISFSTEVRRLWAESRTASTANRDIAFNWVNGLSAGGSTNINDALATAMGSFVGSNNVKVVAFLSDGQPTVGVTDTESIRSNVNSANIKEAAIFSISLGTSTEEGLMAGLAYDSGGEFTVILPNDDAITKLNAFYERFATPVAQGVTISYTGATEIYPNPGSLSGPLFNGSEILQTGRYSNQLDIAITIRISTGDLTYTSSATTANSGPQIERLWAQNTIKQLLKQVFIQGSSVELNDRIVSIAVQYGLVVPGYTGLTVVLEEPNAPDISSTDTSYSTAPGSTTYATTAYATTAYATMPAPATSAVQETANLDAQKKQEVSNTTEQSPGLTFLISLMTLITAISVKHKYRK